MPRRPDPQLRRWWRQLLAGFDSQRMTVAQFCDQNSISVASFYKWRKRLAEPQNIPTVIPVEIIGQATQQQPSAAVIRIAELAEIEINPSHLDLATDIAVAIAMLHDQRNAEPEVTP